MSLFDAFPDNQKLKQVEEWVVPGAIVYLTCSWVQKAYKDKYLLVGSVNPQCLMLMINTDARRITLQTQVQLFVADYPGALTGDCFIDCSTAVSAFTVQQARDDVIKNSSRYKGRLISKHQQNVVAAIKFARDISPIHKRYLLTALDVPI